MDQKYYDVSYAESPFGTLNQYMTGTFGWMFAGLLVTFAVAMATAFSGLYAVLYGTGLVFLLSIAELVLVVVLSARITKLRPGTATALFFAYAALTGVNLSVYMVVYGFHTLMLAFLLSAVYFGVMAVYGATTGKDLSGWGPKLLGGLVALIVAQLVGMVLSFFGLSFGLGDLLLCAVGLCLFMGLSAYDTQKIKYYYSYFGADAVMLHKASIIAALELYLDFINIFLYMVRILGRSSRDN